MFIAIFVALAIAVGTSITAQGTVPGQMLYPVKVHVNENIESVWSVSAEADARIKAAHALRRIDEAQELAASAKLDAQTRTEIIARFKEDTDAMERYIQKLEVRGDAATAAEIRSSFAANLNAHANAMVEASLGSSEMKTIAMGIADAAHARLSGEAQANANTSANGQSNATTSVDTRNRIDLDLGL